MTRDQPSAVVRAVRVVCLPLVLPFIGMWWLLICRDGPAAALPHLAP